MSDVAVLGTIEMVVSQRRMSDGLVSISRSTRSPFPRSGRLAACEAPRDRRMFRNGHQPEKRGSRLANRRSVSTGRKALNPS
jgi:hypothetical protein